MKSGAGVGNNNKGIKILGQSYSTGIESRWGQSPTDLSFYLFEVEGLVGNKSLN
jgi:hypothetical protein